MDFKFPNIGSMKTLTIKNALTDEVIGKYDLIYSADIPVLLFLFIGSFSSFDKNSSLEI